LLREALQLAEPSGELLRIGHVALAEAEAAWLVGDREGIIAATDRVFSDALEYAGEWPLADLTLWRSRAGLDSPPLSDPDSPQALEVAGDPGRAAERWTDLGCPYEAALALAHTDDEVLVRRARVELERLGAMTAAAAVR